MTMTDLSIRGKASIRTSWRSQRPSAQAGIPPYTRRGQRGLINLVSATIRTSWCPRRATSARVGALAGQRGLSDLV